MAHESVELLSRFVQLNTANPPGNEARGAQFLAGILDKEGIEYRTYEPDPGRVSLRAIIPGTGEKGPVILLNHTDVVPAQAEEWSFDPFGGEVKDGYVHGRGVLDMKGQSIMELLAFLDVKRRGQKPCRDLIFLAAADEETGGTLGVKYLLKNHYEDFQADVVLNEGGFAVTGLIPSRPVIMVSPAEKGVCWLKLTRTGQPGHGSLPHGDNALERMNHALARLLDWKPPITVTPIIDEYFKRLGSGLEFLGPYRDDGNPETLKRILTESGLIDMPQVSALVRNTISLTAMQAGIKVNVIPSRAEAQLDIRLLPGQDIDEFITQVKNKLADDEIEIECLDRTEPTESPRNTELFVLLQDVLAENFPGSLITPSLLFATSDSRFFRQRGIPAYGVCPALVGLEDLNNIHGIDEKISAKNMVKGTAVFTKIVRRLCTT